jgi:hypothetical protein
VLAAVSEDARHEAGFQSEHDYAQAQVRVGAMKTTGELNEAAVFKFAKTGCYADMVVAVSLLCGTPLTLVLELLESGRREAILVPCKAAGLGWPTVRVILNCRAVGGTMSDGDIDSARTDYAKLSQNTAQRVIRFWQVRKSASNGIASSDVASLRVSQSAR